MATSPNTSTLSPSKKKDETFLDKIGTMGRKKKAKEVSELQEEGKNAIESPTSPTIPDIGPEGYQLGVHSKNLVAILHLLVALARHFHAPIRMPDNVVVTLIVIQKVENILQTRYVPEEITTNWDDVDGRGERDAFDTLFDHAPDKLNVVKKTLLTFVNKHLMRLNLEVTDLDNQFHDGVFLIMMMGLLEGYFTPLYQFHVTPTTFEHRVHNVKFAFELMEDAGLQRPKARPEDIVNQDLKSTLRVLYNIFTKYKSSHGSQAIAVQ